MEPSLPATHSVPTQLAAIFASATDAAIRPWCSPPSLAAAVAESLDRGDRPLPPADAARLLLEKGADRTLADNDGDTAASYYVPEAPTEEAKAQLRALLA